MKRPWLDEYERLLIRLNTAGGERLMFALRWEQLKRSIRSCFYTSTKDNENKCARCGDIDEEANVCGDCHRTICDLCMSDFISNQCLDCTINDEEE